MAYDDDQLPEIPRRRPLTATPPHPLGPGWAEADSRVWIQPKGKYPATPEANPGPYRDDYHPQQGPAPEPPTMPTTPAAPREVPPPRAESTTMPEMPGQEQQLREREGELYAKVHPVAKHGWGRFGQIMGRIGSDAVDAVFPNVMPNIPGTREQAARELYQDREQLQREEQLDIERQKSGLPTIDTAFIPRGPNEQPMA